MKSPRKWRRDLERRRAERELFFSTAFNWLRLIVVAVIVANFVLYVLTSWIQGDPPSLEPVWRFLT